MAIEVLRVGQRIVRDDRVTTHVALVSRAFGAKKIFMNEVNPDIKDNFRIKSIKLGEETFKLRFIDNWKQLY